MSFSFHWSTFGLPVVLSEGFHVCIQAPCFLIDSNKDQWFWQFSEIISNPVLVHLWEDFRNNLSCNFFFFFTNLIKSWYTTTGCEIISEHLLSPYFPLTSSLIMRMFSDKENTGSWMVVRLWSWCHTLTLYCMNYYLYI